MQQHIFGPIPLGPGEGSKGQVSSNFNNKVNFEELFYTKLCVNMPNGIFILSPGSCPRGGPWGCWEVKYLICPNMDMGHIKLKGVISRTGYK